MAITPRRPHDTIRPDETAAKIVHAYESNHYATGLIGIGDSRPVALSQFKWSSFPYHVAIKLFANPPDTPALLNKDFNHGRPVSQTR